MGKKLHPRVTISGKEQSLSFNKDTIIALNDPEYIYLLINEDSNTVAVVPGEREGIMTFKVPSATYDKKHWQLRIYSKQFVVQMMAINHLDENKSFRFSGEYLEERNAVIFNLTRVAV